MYPFHPCSLKQLPDDVLTEARDLARRINPANSPPAHALARLALDEPQHLALLTSTYWGSGGAHLRVYFMDGARKALRIKILSHMNAWSEGANVRFREGDARSEVRVARQPGQGYYSYLGTDILHISRSKQTMNLEGFTLDTPESEFKRVVRHEAGHALGFIHEHLRRGIVELLDPKKTIAWFQRHDRWSPETTEQQVLTAVDDALLTATGQTDQDSIMCYQLSGECTRSGEPIRGGPDIDTADRDLAARLYPLPGGTPPAAPGQAPVDMAGLLAQLVYLLSGRASR